MACTSISRSINCFAPLPNSIREATPFQAVLVSIYEPDSGLLRRVTGIGFPPETLAELMARKQPLSSIQQMLKPQFRISRSYFIPVDDAPIIPADVHMVTVRAAWQLCCPPAPPGIRMIS